MYESLINNIYTIFILLYSFLIYSAQYIIDSEEGDEERQPVQLIQPAQLEMPFDCAVHCLTKSKVSQYSMPPAAEKGSQHTTIVLVRRVES